MRTPGADSSAARPSLCPEAVRRALPASSTAEATVRAGRERLRTLLEGGGPPGRVVIAGPRALHDPDVAFEAARRLRRLSRELPPGLFVVMRAFVAPLLRDPLRDGSPDPNLGVATARQVLLRISELGLACAIELGSPASPYLHDLAVCEAAPGTAFGRAQLHLPYLNRAPRSADGDAGVVHALDLHPRPLRAPLRSDARVRTGRGGG